ncbi:hypothetical protein [Croceicoccus gelatinilyticus]|uniref:hypothetical protein n=1 Tax=Croceicoccus gelatinilyticus TaxID=2835536 RepID=UPI001BCF5BFC|nr:hypothetical protein [Croceicoccus gelatinilyticus]MBS7670098.1 hypothetical protein [Croceicoccus gelatinilyticus]
MSQFPMTLASGTFRLDAVLDDRTRLSCRSDTRSGSEAHPIFAFVAALRGAGTSIETLCELCGCSIADGPVLASCDIEYLAPMPVDETYRVDARIAERIEKPSRRFGQAVHAFVEFSIGRGEDECARVRLHIIMPRSADHG